MPTNPANVPGPSLTVKTFTKDDSTVVECSGQLVAAAIASFKKEVKGLVSRSKRIILDLSYVDYMDSYGLGAVLGLYVTAKKAGCELRATHLAPQVRELLQMTNVLSLFEASD